MSATFLPGHFKGYTIKLNPLDGVYYCDIRPNMQTDPFPPLAYSDDRPSVLHGLLGHCSMSRRGRQYLPKFVGKE